MFRPNWPSADVQVAVVKDSAAHCNAVLYLPRMKEHEERVENDVAHSQHKSPQSQVYTVQQDAEM
jgi:hypothetical protein